VVSSDKCAKEIATRMGVLFLQQQTDEGVNSAIALADDYCLLTGTEASIVLPQDLPLLLPQDVVEICQLAKTSEKCMIICPSLRYDGSNALLRKPPILFSTKYDNDSYNMHRKEALSVGAHVRVILLERIMKDLDTADDALSLVGEPGKGGALRYLKQKLQSKKQVIQD
jgi:2-phospho-L-lactate guanylyltransferase